MNAATLTVGSMIGVMLMGSTIVTPLCSLYAREFSFSAVVLTLIYAACVIGNLTSLLFFAACTRPIAARRSGFSPTARVKLKPDLRAPKQPLLQRSA